MTLALSHSPERVEIYVCVHYEQRTHMSYSIYRVQTTLIIIQHQHRISYSTNTKYHTAPTQNIIQYRVQATQSIIPTAPCTILYSCPWHDRHVQATQISYSTSTYPQYNSSSNLYIPGVVGGRTERVIAALLSLEGAVKL